MSKFIVANLAVALALTSASAAFAAPDPALPSAPTADSPAPSSAPAAQAPAQASEAPAPATQPMAAAKKKSPSDIICKPDTGTGSRVGGVKICLTRQEWRQREMD